MSHGQETRQGWHSATLQDLVLFQRGYDITKAEQKPGDIPVVSSSGINSYHSESKVDGPGIVIGRKGSLGTVHYVEGPYWPHDTTLWSKDLKGNHARFVYYFLQTMGLERFDVGSSNPTLNRNHIHGLNIIMPEYRIQERIVEVISAYDDLIENNRRRIQLLEQAARLLYKEWFVHLRFPGHEHVKITDGVPEGWKKKTIGKCFGTVLGGTPSRKNLAYWAGDVPWINSGEVNKTRIFAATEFITEEGLSKSAAKVMPAGTTVLAVTGATLGQVSRLEIECSANQSVIGIYDKIDLQNEWLYLFFIHEIRKIINHATGGAQQHINKEIVNTTEFLQPKQQLLVAFREEVAPIFDQIRNVGLQNIALSKARDLLLPLLMNGEVAV
jgi:type I restriction enzyme S subunit